MEEREYSEEDMKNNPRFKHHKNIEQVINMQKQANQSAREMEERQGLFALTESIFMTGKPFQLWPW